MSAGKSTGAANTAERGRYRLDVSKATFTPRSFMPPVGRAVWRFFESAILGPYPSISNAAMSIGVRPNGCGMITKRPILEFFTRRWPEFQFIGEKRPNLLFRHLQTNGIY